MGLRAVRKDHDPELHMKLARDSHGAPPQIIGARVCQLRQTGARVARYRCAERRSFDKK